MRTQRRADSTNHARRIVIEDHNEISFHPRLDLGVIELRQSWVLTVDDGSSALHTAGFAREFQLHTIDLRFWIRTRLAYNDSALLGNRSCIDQVHSFF